ncbi:MAG: Unknown protein [uncultured Sulfurovum sp.]|uniref:Uncharacterized protein n=1 Tax=uncultured Sulfurovum sp. TaxID=269237 RepID=A0A6S6RYH2_9BACT|nr:MAG: Unknown protein [uncultured Sulfurovum sp.]
MQSKITFVLLFVLSFSVFHDSFISLMDDELSSSSTHYMSDNVESSEPTELHELHNIFHFMAIVSFVGAVEVRFAKKETIAHVNIAYTPPIKKTSYKPPIA